MTVDFIKEDEPTDMNIKEEKGKNLKNLSNPEIYY